MLDQLLSALSRRAGRVVDWQQALTAFAAMGPANGGTGESAKAEWICGVLRAAGITDIQTVTFTDNTTPTPCPRPNILARIPGKSPRTVWLLAHMDVVPPGDPALWHTDPWHLEQQGDTLIGRGVEDNQQGLVSALLLAVELAERGITPDCTLGLAFVADEETDNIHGMRQLMREPARYFVPGDMFVVPDAGSPDGSAVEIAEKHVLWLKFELLGKQCHGSTPHKGVNAMLAGSALALRLAALGERFPREDALFDPPCSTFVPTRREGNVPNVNTVPGRDVFYMDCRILPHEDVDVVLAAVRECCAAVEREYGTSVSVHVLTRNDAAPPTPADSEIVRRIIPAIADVYGVTPRLVGIGGSTVACFLRQAGYPAVAWSRILGNCHEPNEKALISNHLGDAQVFAHLVFAPGA